MSIDADQQKIIDGLPHFIAINYHAMLEAENDQRRVESGLVTFECCLRFLTMVMASQYLVRDRRTMSEPYLNRLINERLSLGTLQGWMELLLTSLKTYVGHANLFFVPEMYTFYWDTSDPGKHKPCISLEKNLEYLTEISYDLEYGKNMPSHPAGWKKLAGDVQRSVCDLVHRIAFFAGYDLLSVRSVDESRYAADLERGIQITQITFECAGAELGVNLYYLSNPEHTDFLELDPFITPWKIGNDHTAIFLHMIYQEMQYKLATSGKQAQDTEHLDEFLHLIEIANRDKHLLRRSDDLTWLHLVESAAEISTRRMATVSGKYDPAVYLQREDLLKLFGEFMASASHCFVLTGKSGVGKSNFVMSLVDEYRSDPRLCLLMLDATQIDTGLELSAFIEDVLRDQMGVHKTDVPDLWRAIDHLPDIDNRRFLLILDAVNEHSNPRDLLRQINILLQRPFGWLKILITSRPEAWRRMYNGQHLLEGLFFQPAADHRKQEDRPPLSAFEIESFNWNELQKVYEFYRKKYELLTEYQRLSPQVVRALSDPLQLWLIANSYKGKEIPPGLQASQLVRHYINILIETRRLEKGDLEFLENELVPFMLPSAGHYYNKITAAHLADHAELMKRIFDDGRYSSGDRVNEAFERLVNAQFMVKRVQGQEVEAQFKYERFYDHFAGAYLFKMMPAWFGNLPEGYCQVIAASSESSFLWGAIQRSLQLGFENNQFDLIKQLAQKDDPAIGHVVISALLEFYPGNEQVVRRLVRELLSAKPGSVGAIISSRRAALRIALETGDLAVLELGLLDENQTVQDLAVKYVFYLDQRHPLDSMEVVRSAGDHIMRMGIPDTHVLRILFPLVILLLMERFRAGGAASGMEGVAELTGVLRSMIRRAAYVGNSKGVMRPVGNLARSLLVKSIKQYLHLTLRNNRDETDGGSDIPAASVTMADEIALFFTLPQSLRQTIVRMLPYLNRSHGSLVEIYPDLVDIYASEDIISRALINFVIDSRAGNNVDESFRAFQHIFSSLKVIFPGESKKEKNLLAFAATSIAHNFYSVIERQEVIRLEWLDFMRELTRCHMEDSPYGYGITRTTIRSYIYYTLIFYGAVWNWMYPEQEIDLVMEYLQRAEATHDQKLRLFVINGFGDRRVNITDYRSILRSLKPYLFSQDEQVIKSLVSSLARIRSRKPEQVEHFLLESDAPAKLVEEVRLHCFDEPIYDLITRFSEFLVDFLNHAPPGTVELAIAAIQKAAASPDLENAFEVVIKTLLNGLVAENIFTS